MWNSWSIALENVDDSGNVIAPISGTLVSMNAVENSMISTSMPVAVIDGVDQMKVTVSVSEALVPKLTIGDSADIAVSAAGKSLLARSAPLTGRPTCRLSCIRSPSLCLPTLRACSRVCLPM